MIDNLRRIREPLAWTLIVLVVLTMGLTGWKVVTSLAAPGEDTVFSIFSDAGLSWLNMSIAIPLVIVVLLCSLFTPATPRAPLITWVAAIVLSVGVVLTLVSTLLGMWASANGVGVVLDVLGGLFDLAFKAVVAGSLWVLIRGVRGGHIETPAPAVSGDVLGPAAHPPAAETPNQASTWTRSSASGSAWRTAAEAASGAPGRDRIDEEPEQGTEQD